MWVATEVFQGCDAAQAAALPWRALVLACAWTRAQTPRKSDKPGEHLSW